VKLPRLSFVGGNAASIGYYFDFIYRNSL